MIPQVPEGQDRILWHGENDGRYTAAFAYKLLTENDQPLSRLWKLVWRCKAPEKVRFFLWLVAREALPTNQRRKLCNFTADESCPSCGALVEDGEHILRTCVVAQQIWNHFRSLLPRMPSTLSFRAWLAGHLQHADHAFSYAVLWLLWTWRNNKVLES